MKNLSVQTSSGLLAYREAGTGPVVVLLHAFPLDSEMWTSQIESFANHYRVIAPDVPGFGASPALVDLTIDRIATGVRDLIDALNISAPIVLGGLSMGGYVALAFARMFPNRLRALILADTKADPDDEAGRAGRDKMIALVQKEGTRSVVEQLLPKLLGTHTQSEKPEIVQRVRGIASRQAPASVASALKALRDRPDSKPLLGKIAVPTLVIVGEKDGITPPAKAAELRDGIPNAVLVSIPNAGHLANLENESVFTQAVITFLAGLMPSMT